MASLVEALLSCTGCIFKATVPVVVEEDDDMTDVEGEEEAAGAGDPVTGTPGRTGGPEPPASPSNRPSANQMESDRTTLGESEPAVTPIGAAQDCDRKACVEISSFCFPTNPNQNS